MTDPRLLTLRVHPTRERDARRLLPGACVISDAKVTAVSWAPVRHGGESGVLDFRRGVLLIGGRTEQLQTEPAEPASTRTTAPAFDTF